MNLRPSKRQLPLVVLLALTAIAAGCREQAGSDKLPSASTSTAEQPAPVSHSPELDTLLARAETVKRDGRGRVIDVDFSGISFDEGQIERLAELPAVRRLRLADSNISDDALPVIARIATLRDLDLRGCGITNEGLGHLKSLSELRVLRLSGENGKTAVDDDGMKALASLPKLKTLYLDHLWIGTAGLESLVPLQSIEELYLARTLVDDESVAKLAAFPNLKKLRIAATQVTDAGLASLQACGKLMELDLSENSQISDQGMPAVGKLAHLTKLNLWRVAIGDEGVRPLSKLTELRWLNLDNTQVTDDGLQYLRPLTKLEFLHLGSTAISDDGLSQLTTLRSLKHLSVTRTAVTKAGAAKLKQSLPNTEIQLDYLGQG